MAELKNSQAQPRPTSLSQVFTAKVLNELVGSVGKMEVTEEQRRLVQGYYMGCDKALRTAEERRKGDKKPFVWANVNIDSTLAQNIVNYMRVGIDMGVENSLWVVPMYNGKNGKYDLTFRIGFEGRKQLARKYSLDEIVDIKDDLIYSTDKFKVVKRDSQHEIENYELEVTSPFDRGELVGGFVYVEFANPRKNFVFLMSKKDIEKHKAKAQTNSIWDEWYDLMARKTILHAACKKISLDPQKISDNYCRIVAADVQADQLAASQVIAENANNGAVIDVDVPEQEPVAIPQQTTVQQPVPQTVIEQAEQEQPVPNDAIIIDEPF